MKITGKMYSQPITFPVFDRSYSYLNYAAYLLLTVSIHTHDEPLSLKATLFYPLLGFSTSVLCSKVVDLRNPNHEIEKNRKENIYSNFRYIQTDVQYLKDSQTNVIFLVNFYVIFWLKEFSEYQTMVNIMVSLHEVSGYA